jgi:hypothetical protein
LKVHKFFNSKFIRNILLEIIIAVVQLFFVFLRCSCTVKHVSVGSRPIFCKNAANGSNELGSLAYLFNHHPELAKTLIKWHLNAFSSLIMTTEERRSRQLVAWESDMM